MTVKLIQTAQNQLSVNVLYKLANSEEVADFHPELQHTAWTSLVALSDKHDDNRKDLEFENLIPELCHQLRQKLQDPTKDELHFRQQALLVLANTSLRSYLRPMITANDGVQIFIDAILGKSKYDFGDSIFASRVAAKGLMNLALSKKEVRQHVVGQLTEVIEQVMRGKCDQVVAGYLNALIRGGV